MLGFGRGRNIDPAPTTVSTSPYATPSHKDVTVLDWTKLRGGTAADAWEVLSQIIVTGGCYRLPDETVPRKLDEITSQRILTAHALPLMSALPDQPSTLTLDGVDRSRVRTVCVTHRLTAGTVPPMRRLTA